MPIALAAGVATLVQAVTSFGLGQILGVAAQRAITDMRKRVQAHVMRLPVRYFDSTQTGVLDLPHHVRRRGHQKPGRHRPRAARGRVRDRRDGDRPCSSG